MFSTESPKYVSCVYFFFKIIVLFDIYIYISSDLFFIVKEINIASFADGNELYLKFKRSSIWLVDTVWARLIFLVAAVQISIECETHKR